MKTKGQKKAAKKLRLRAQEAKFQHQKLMQSSQASIPRKGPITQPKDSLDFRRAVEQFLGLMSTTAHHFPSGTALTSRPSEHKLTKRDSGDYELVTDSESLKKGSEPEVKVTPEYVEKYLAIQKRLVGAVALAKSLFKADKPYRCRLSKMGSFATTGAGVVNLQPKVADVTSVSEWTAIDSLFDEIFVHSMTIRWYPINNRFQLSYTGTSVTQLNVSTSGAATLDVTAAGLIKICLFGVPAYFSTAAGMQNSPTRSISMSNDPWSYTWRNNVRFDPRGLNLSSASNVGWSGWTQVSEASFLGGAIQVRAMNDEAFGTGGIAVTLADYVQDFDVSFRVRL